MPIYEYECQSCGKSFERLQKMSDPNPEQCDHCGQGPIKKLISLSGFILKGSGYYTTENPSAARREGVKAEQSATTASAPASSTTTKKE